MLDRANRDGAGYHRTYRIDFRLDPFEGIERVGRQLQRHPPGRTQFETCRSALAQSHTQAFLYLLDMPADRGLGHIQPALSRGKPARFSGGTEDAQGTQVTLGKVESVHGQKVSDSKTISPIK
ncbi:hypothetical protein D3C86_1690480 [compost metagenome]